MSNVTKMAILTAIVATSASMSVNATVLTFDGLGLPIYGAISQDYGDRVTATSDATGNYLAGNGFTGNITASYRTSNPDNSLHLDYVDYWSTSYGDLVDVAFAANNGKYAEVTLTADAGWNVLINSFDMAGWPTADVALAGLSILDSSGATLWDSGVSIIHGAGSVHDSFSPNITANSLTLRWGTNWDIGLDNLNFDQVRAPVSVPEPASIVLLSLGLIGLGISKRKFKAA